MDNKKLAPGILAALLAAGSLASCHTDGKGEDGLLLPAEGVSGELEGIADTAVSAKESPWTKTKHELRFGEDGEFKILIISDTHGSGNSLLPVAKANIKLLIDREQPDLVMFDGDNTWGMTNEKNLEECITDMVEYIESKQIPWGHVYGNHDDEGDSLTKAVQQKIYESFEYCVSMSGDENLSGVGNYVLPIYASAGDKVVFNVWALDSGSYLSGEERAAYLPVVSTYQGYSGSSYDYIHPDQIQWYMSTSQAMEAYNGEKVPGLMAFHIPLQEFYNAWVNRDALNYTGEKREVVCASEINSGLFAAMVERGDIKAVVSGHDHVNDYMVEYGGIKLCYASTVGNNAYYDADMLGGRVFVIHEDEPANVMTYMSYIDESKMAAAEAVLNRENLASGIAVDFESYMPEIYFCGWNNDTSGDAHVDQIRIEVTEGRGRNGSCALALTRTAFHDSNTGNNAEASWTLENPGLLGDNKYVRVWMDLTGDGTAVDFRKACFGLIENGVNLLPYNTDDRDTPTPFYYLAEGETEWVEMSHGSDGCFGKAENSSVKGFKGWFAFPIENMPRRGNGALLKKDSYITGFYLYYCLSSADMAGQNVYIDECAIVEDYTRFD